MKIILSGGGSGNEVIGLDKKFALLLDKSKPLLYIPIAIDNIKHPYSECLKWLKATFNNLGITKYEMWIEGNLEKAKEVSPDKFSGIYIGGGNTPYLLKKIKRTGFWSFIKKAMEIDVPIYGGSAGAIIFSKTIVNSLYSDKNWVEIKNLAGLNVLNGHQITVHYDKNQEGRLIKISKNNKSEKIIALTKKNGLYVTNNGATLLGKEKAYIFEDGKVKEISIGESFKLKPVLNTFLLI